MDNLDFRGAEMQRLLTDLKTVNQWLGGYGVTINALDKLLKAHPKYKEVVILDVGCGDGAQLRQCVDFGRKHQLNIKGIGLDFNQNILEMAKKESRDYPSLSFQKVDVFLDQKSIPNSDIALCTLFLHHFGNEEIESLLKVLMEKNEMGLIVNDLHRNRTAFNLFKLFWKLFLRSETAWNDGLISIASGFRRSELEKMATRIPNQKSSIRWCWAFRYQWILKKTV